jgi:hypothetical protein
MATPFYNIILSYVDGKVLYTKQNLNVNLDIQLIPVLDETTGEPILHPVDRTSINRYKIIFPTDLIPGSETLFVDGYFVESAVYDLNTGFYDFKIQFPGSVYCTYNSILEQEPGMADHEEMPSLTAIGETAPVLDLETIVNPGFTDENV